MPFLLAAAVVVAFAIIIERLRLPARAREAGTRARDSLRVLRSRALDDREKEEALQRNALRLFVLLGILAGGSLLAILAPLAAVGLLDLADVASLGAVLAILERPDFLAGATLAGGTVYLALHRIRDE